LGDVPDRKGRGTFFQVDFRHEFEFGITDKLQLSVYVADWQYQSGFAGNVPDLPIPLQRLRRSQPVNPVADPVGFSVYEEVKVGDRLVESESKLIAQKTSAR
jgi:hypothetical protein